MKKFLLFIIILFSFTGCMPGTVEESKSFEAGIPNINSEKNAGVGDTFFKFTRMGSLYVGDNWMFDLTVVELNEQKLGLQYSEYFYKVPRLPGDSSGWLIKEGFNKRFDYAVADKIIRFKGYEFEIIAVEKGQIKYKRTK